MTESLNMNVLVEAKNEYTKQLTKLLVPQIYQGIKSIYDEARTLSEAERNPNVLIVFQKFLREIPRWNADIIQAEYERIRLNCECEWLDDLVKATFIANSKIYCSIRIGNTFKKVKLEIPTTDKFIHRAYIEVARSVYKNPILFYHKGTSDGYEFHRNMRETYELIQECIEEAIRKLIPIKQILHEYLGDSVECGEEGDISDVNKPPEYLKQLAQTEIASMTTPPPTESVAVPHPVEPPVPSVPVVSAPVPGVPQAPATVPIAPVQGVPMEGGAHPGQTVVLQSNPIVPAQIPTPTLQTPVQPMQGVQTPVVASNVMIGGSPFTTPEPASNPPTPPHGDNSLIAVEKADSFLSDDDVISITGSGNESTPEVRSLVLPNNKKFGVKVAEQVAVVPQEPRRPVFFGDVDDELDL